MIRNHQILFTSSYLGRLALKHDEHTSYSSKNKDRGLSFSDHAVKRMIKRAINRHEIEEAILTGESVEEYPNDKHSPTCLICGKTSEGRVLHIHRRGSDLLLTVL